MVSATLSRDIQPFTYTTYARMWACFQSRCDEAAGGCSGRRGPDPSRLPAEDRIHQPRRYQLCRRGAPDRDVRHGLGDGRQDSARVNFVTPPQPLHRRRQRRPRDDPVVADKIFAQGCRSSSTGFFTAAFSSEPSPAVLLTCLFNGVLRARRCSRIWSVRAPCGIRARPPQARMHGMHCPPAMAGAVRFLCNQRRVRLPPSAPRLSGRLRQVGSAVPLKHDKSAEASRPRRIGVIPPDQLSVLRRGKAKPPALFPSAARSRLRPIRPASCKACPSPRHGPDGSPISLCTPCSTKKRDRRQSL